MTTLAYAFPQRPPAAYPVAPAQVPPWLVRRAPYRARFARTLADLHAIQRLRYRVFNLELGEGLAESARAATRTSSTRPRTTSS